VLKKQKITIWILIGIICVTLIGSSFIAIFTPSGQAPSGQTASDENQATLAKEYADRKARVDTLTELLAESPQDISLKQALGDAYYDKSQVTGQMNVDEYKEDLRQAINNYQSVLQTKKDNDLMNKLGAAAFLAGDDELAEKTFIELLNRDPKNVEALYSYGMFLFYAKNDHQQALEKWEKALSLASDDQIKERLQEMIALAKGMNTNTGQAQNK
jgi:tetratricopeptide (TPR) repeat protein